MNIELVIHTDDEQVCELCTDYWRLADKKMFTCKLSELSEKHNLPAADIRRLVNRNSTAFSCKLSCIKCGVPYSFKSRTDYLDSWRTHAITHWICDTCDEVQKKEKAVLREKKKHLKYDILCEFYQGECADGLTIAEISFSDAVYLLSVIRTGASEDLSHIVPHEYYEIPLSPSKDFDREILLQLYHDYALSIHPHSNQETITIVNKDPTSFRFDPLGVHWLLPISDEQRPEHIVKELERLLPSKEWPATRASEVNALRTRIALEESLQYLRYVLSEHGFNFTIGEKTIQVVKSLLNEFSVAQIYNFCWRAAKDAASFYMRKYVSKQHAANTVTGSIKRMSEKSLAEGWEVKSFRRNFDLPQCMVSQVLYNTTLKIGDSGFNRPVPKGKKK